ncbi:MAG: hypothetical protein ABI970_06680 [Chloroflexota bacterium]
MQVRRSLSIGLAVLAIIAVLVLVVVALTTPQTNPAFEVAANFANAAGHGDDAAALPLLSSDLAQAVASTCKDGKPSSCVQGYAPPEWGALEHAVFRRAVPDGAAWDIEVIATYEHDKGASGVCSYFHVSQIPDGQWKIDRWAGFIWCGDPRSRDMATNPNTPNRMP